GILIVLGAAIAPHLGTELFPRADAGSFVVQMRLASGTRIEKTHAFASEIIGKMHRWVDPQDLDLIISNEGVYYGFPAAYTPNAGTQDMFFIVGLTEKRTHTSQYYAKVVRDKMAQEYPNVEVNCQLGGLLTSALNAGLPAPIDIQIQGPKMSVAHDVAQQILDRIKTLPGAVDVRIQQRIDTPAYKMTVDRQKAAAIGLTVDEVVKNVVSAVSGSATFNPAIWVDPKTGIDYFMGVQFDLKLFDKLSDLLNIPITGENQIRSVPLAHIATVTEAQVPTEVDHDDLQRVMDVYLDAQGRDVGSLSRAVEEAIHDIRVPDGYSWRIAGEISQMRRAVNSLGGGFVLAAILVYLILVVQFRSFILPMIMMISVPLGLVGVVAALAATRTYFSIQAAIGAIFMIGIAVANGVLLIEFILHHLRDAKDMTTAIVQGAQARLRPIMMTSLASVLGLVPMAVGYGHGAEANIPLGRAVIGGQLVSTALTLVVVPVLFSLIFARQHRKKSGSSSNGDGDGSSDPAPSPTPSQPVRS
ncbi:MAG TPA: efflux RND transporter permease subunit, partial [Elusimicrobiota bacterium]|nr:efflux RND transporter permease subunit [Elusimicrobiota bacterium]